MKRKELIHHLEANGRPPKREGGSIRFTGIRKSAAAKRSPETRKSRTCWPGKSAEHWKYGSHVFRDSKPELSGLPLAIHSSSRVNSRLLENAS